ncbi:hypothetical protein [Legionella taurinensis]|uniref:hypothetical protein n=1 Tax=Legionella taurinensis TaxID=70611 RepID=UPI00299E45F8|nr:hypothetical protein [Legionella taurinensis]MDX1837282.1 hypothetical protein [Legionella taurinensis]
MLNDLLKQLYSAWKTFDLTKVDYESDLFKSYSDKFLKAEDSVSKTTVLIEMASKKLPPDAAMLTELINQLVMDAKKTNDTAIYIRIELIYEMFNFTFLSSDDLHRAAFTAFKEGNRTAGIQQVKTLKLYSDEMKLFFQSENTRIDQSRVQSKKSIVTRKGEAKPKKPQHEGILTTKPAVKKTQHKQCLNPQLQNIINLFPSSLFNKKLFSNLEESETIHANEFSNLSLADMRVKYYNFLWLPTALKYPAVHDQVIINLLGEQKEDLDWDLILAIYNNAYTDLTSSSREILFTIFRRLCEVGKHDIAMEVFQTHKAIIDNTIYFRMLHAMEPDKESIAAMLESGLSSKMYLPNITLMEYYLQKYGIQSKISQDIKESVYSKDAKASRTTIDLHGAPKKAVADIIMDFVENGKDKQQRIVVSHGGGTHVALSQYTLNNMNDVQFFSPVKKAVYETVRYLQRKWKGKYLIEISPYQTARYIDHSNSVISTKTVHNKLWKEANQKKQPSESGKVTAPDAMTAIDSSLLSTDNVVFTTTASVTQDQLTSTASEPKATGKLNPKAFEYRPKNETRFKNPPPVDTNPTRFGKEEISPTQDTMESTYEPPLVTLSSGYHHTFFAHEPPYQSPSYMELFESEINTETEEPNTPNWQRNITME